MTKNDEKVVTNNISLYSFGVNQCIVIGHSTECLIPIVDKICTRCQDDNAKNK